MSEQHKPDVSRLMDNDDVDRDTIQRISNDKMLRDQWERYHLVRDVIREETPPHVALNLSDRISEIIATEPTILAPRQATHRNYKPVLKQLTGLALAASLTAVSIFGVQSLLKPDITSQQTVQMTHARSTAPQAIPYTLLANQQSLSERTRTAEVLRKRQLERINSYLIQHAEQASSRGVNGMFPYARVVSYDE